MFSVCYMPEIASQWGQNSPESLLPYLNDLGYLECHSQIFFCATFLLHSCVASCVLWAVQSCIFQLAVDLSVFGKKGQHLTGCCKPTEASESLEKPFSPELCPSSDSVVVIVEIILWSWDWLKSKSPKAKWEWHIESVMDLPKADRWKKKKKKKSDMEKDRDWKAYKDEQAS